jgi:RND family efflux transporter MFP subunit
MPIHRLFCRRLPLATAAIVAFSCLAGCQHAAPEGEKAAAAAPAAPSPQVTVVEATLDLWPETVRVQGSLLGDERAVVGAKIPGRVETVAVDLGSIVRKGDTLVTLDRRELELRVREAEAQLNQACAAIGLSPDQDELELRRDQAPPVLLEKALVEEARAAVARVERLSSRQATSDSEWERLVAQLKTAEARYQSALNSVGEQIALIGVRRTALALAKQQLEEATIAAPFDGVVEQRQVSPGEYVQVGQAVVALVRTDKLRFTAGAPESKATAIHQGQTIYIHAAGEPKPIEATISRVSPMVTQSSRALWIEADVPNPELRRQAGLFAQADIVIDPYAKALTVPAKSITEFAGIEKVWIVRAGKASELPVRTGRRDGDRVEILDDPTSDVTEKLAPGDLIVSDAAQGHAGEVVAVRDQAARPAPVSQPTLSAE